MQWQADVLVVVAKSSRFLVAPLLGMTKTR
jgi:hypothetical protein